MIEHTRPGRRPELWTPERRPTDLYYQQLRQMLAVLGLEMALGEDDDNDTVLETGLQTAQLFSRIDQCCEEADEACIGGPHGYWLVCVDLNDSEESWEVRKTGAYRLDQSLLAWPEEIARATYDLCDLVAPGTIHEVEAPK